ncbi:MAG: PQQ-dependent sugar dehydrogenase [Thermodesulfovibrionales bacterium]
MTSDSVHFCLALSVRILLIALLCGCGGGGGGGGVGPVAPPPQLVLSAFVSGFTQPVDLQVPNDNSGRLFVVEQGGRIRIIQSGTLVPLPFLDISGKIFFPTGSEEGLLGLSFHPNYPVNGRFFVNYVRAAGPTGRQSVIAEYRVTSDPNVAVPASERILLTVDQPFDNHKAGQLAFGNDSRLYFGFGDGGSGGDPFGNGQNKNTLLGKMLRIDVDSVPTPGKAYAIPPDNPFSGGGGLPEIWAYGLRNPWRFSFDRASGRMFCADVGQNRLEEVDLITRGGNYGWNIMEGDVCFNPSSGCDTTGLLLPITQYSHSEGTAVIGGYVYHGLSIPGLNGTYVFGDLSGGKVWGLQQDSAGNWQRTLILSHSLTVSSFGQDQDGELYLLDYSNGSVLRILGR